MSLIPPSVVLSRSTYSGSVANENVNTSKLPWKIGKVILQNGKVLIGSQTRWKFEVEQDPPGSIRHATLTLNPGSTAELSHLNAHEYITILVQYQDNDVPEALTVTLSDT